MDSALNIVLDIFRNIWYAGDNLLFRFPSVGANFTLNQFYAALIAIGVILSIFLSFVNINNIRSSYSSAESKVRFERRQERFKQERKNRSK